MEYMSRVPQKCVESLAGDILWKFSVLKMSHLPGYRHGPRSHKKEVGHFWLLYCEGCRVRINSQYHTNRKIGRIPSINLPSSMTTRDFFLRHVTHMSQSLFTRIWIKSWPKTESFPCNLQPQFNGVKVFFSLVDGVGQYMIHQHTLVLKSIQIHLFKGKLRMESIWGKHRQNPSHFDATFW